MSPDSPHRERLLMMRSPLVFTVWLAAGAWLGGPMTTKARATWQDEIGYSQLVRELGSSFPTGSGVSLTLVEAELTTLGGEYLPSAETAPETGNFEGKSFDFRSGDSPVSFHAARVGAFMFGRNTDPLAGDASVAPLAGSGPSASVDCYESDRWMGADFLRLGSLQQPRPEPQSIGNHSWIGAINPEFPAARANEALRRLDAAVDVSNHLAVVGLNNGAGTVVPPILGSAFNVLAIGRTDGNHSTGSTPTEVDGAGRLKPELVAPMTATSWSTAVVSSCAAVLAETSRSLGAGAQQSEVQRALLLAGARKSPFTSWSNSPTRPLDAHFGAGEVNIWRSHQALVAGEVAPGVPAALPRSGWHFEPALAVNASRTYSLLVPTGCLAREVSVALVWNRRLGTGGSSLWLNPSPILPNLDLRWNSVPGNGPAIELSRSESGAAGSVPHPLEYIYQQSLPKGTYQIHVLHGADSTSTDYGLAWFLDLAPAAEPELAFLLTPGNGSATLTATRLGIGLTYALEVSDDLLTWETQHTVVATTTSAEFIVSTSTSRANFRLAWRPATAVAAPASVSQN